MESISGSSKRKRGFGIGSGIVRFGAVSLLAVMLAVSLLPLTQSSASADEELVISDFVLADESDQIEVNPELLDEADQTEINPGILDEAIPDDEPEDPTGTVEVTKLGCEESYEGDYAQLIANCVPMAASFVVTSSTGEQIYPGSFSAEGVGAGEVTVAEVIPEGYGDPIVFCFSTDAAGVVGGVWQAEVEFGVLYYELAAGELLYCDWMNIPSENIQGIEVNKHLCPPEFPSAATYDEFAASCTEQHNGVPFNLYYADSLFAEETTGDEIPGGVEFDGLQTGTYGIGEEIPAGFLEPVVFCTTYTWADAISTSEQLITMDGYALLELEYGDYILCDWYNIPTDDGDDDGSIEIHKWECPADLVFMDEPTLEELLEACTTVLNGIQFDLTYPDDAGLTGETRYTGDDGDGTVIFTGVEAGIINVTEQIPDGYGDPVVWCGWGAIYDEDGEGGAPPIAVDGQVPGLLLAGGVLEHEFYPNETMYCDWFNFPDLDRGGITVHKYTCAPGYDLEAPGADPKADCLQKTDGVGFTLSGVIPDNYASTGDVIPGAVSWVGLPFGDYTVAEDVPADIIRTFVICQWEDDLGPFLYNTFEPYTLGDYAVGNRIDLDLIEGSDIVCHWYNIPDDPDGGDLVVIKFWCEGAIYNEASCELYGFGAEFLLQAASGEGDPISFETGGDGTAQLYLPAGAYVLTEVDRTWCKATSDQIDDDGNIVILDDYTTTVTVFNCGPGWEKDPPVKKFPNTGIGAGTENSGLGLGTLAMLATVMLAVAWRISAAAPNAEAASVPTNRQVDHR